MAKDATTVAARWAQNLGAATQRITEGVDAVTVAPGQLAARQKAVWMQNIQAAQDKWARNVQSVPLSEWQQSMKDKGINRIAAGATAAQPKMAMFLQSFLPHIDAGVRALPPRGNLQQNISRAVAMINHNASFVKKG